MTQEIHAILLSASSDISSAICEDWLEKGWNVYGTYRTPSAKTRELENHPKVRLVPCDLLDLNSMNRACHTLQTLCPKWDLLLIAPATLEPIGKFPDVSFDAWEESMQINLLKPLHMLHQLLPFRNIDSPLPQPTVLFFAGGGTNNATLYYSSYTLAKIALIKMVELLDAEIPDTRFVIIGPGWVKTKALLATLKAGRDRAGESYQKTVEKLNSDECTPLQTIIDCCNWLITTNAPVNGRNFSVVHDAWNTGELENALARDPNMYKLRRHQNDWKSPQGISSFFEIKREPSL